MVNVTLDLIYNEILNLKKEVRKIKDDDLELNSGFIKEMKSIRKEKGVKFNSISELDKLVENA